METVPWLGPVGVLEPQEDGALGANGQLTLNSDLLLGQCCVTVPPSSRVSGPSGVLTHQPSGSYQLVFHSLKSSKEKRDNFYKAAFIQLKDYSLF